MDEDGVHFFLHDSECFHGSGQAKLFIEACLSPEFGQSFNFFGFCFCKFVAVLRAKMEVHGRIPLPEGLSKGTPSSHLVKTKLLYQNMGHDTQPCKMPHQTLTLFEPTKAQALQWTIHCSMHPTTDQGLQVDEREKWFRGWELHVETSNFRKGKQNAGQKRLKSPFHFQKSSIHDPNAMHKENLRVDLGEKVHVVPWAS